MSAGNLIMKAAEQLKNEGRKKEKWKIAERLLLMGIESEKVGAITDLDENDIQELVIATSIIKVDTVKQLIMGGQRKARWEIARILPFWNMSTEEIQQVTKLDKEEIQGLMYEHEAQFKVQ